MLPGVWMGSGEMSRYDSCSGVLEPAAPHSHKCARGHTRTAVRVRKGAHGAGLDADGRGHRGSSDERKDGKHGGLSRV